MEWIPVKLFLVVQLTTWGVETDGTVNHLLETQRSSQTQYSVSISTNKPLPIKENFWYEIVVEGECSKLYAMNPDDDNKPRHGDWGTWSRAWICNANRIKLNNEIYIDISQEDK